MAPWQSRCARAYPGRREGRDRDSNDGGGGAARAVSRDAAGTGEHLRPHRSAVQAGVRRRRLARSCPAIPEAPSPTARLHPPPHRASPLAHGGARPRPPPRGHGVRLLRGQRRGRDSRLAESSRPLRRRDRGLGGGSPLLQRQSRGRAHPHGGGQGPHRGRAWSSRLLRGASIPPTPPPRGPHPASSRAHRAGRVPLQAPSARGLRQVRLSGAALSELHGEPRPLSPTAPGGISRHDRAGGCRVEPAAPALRLARSALLRAPVERCVESHQPAALPGALGPARRRLVGGSSLPMAHQPSPARLGMDRPAAAKDSRMATRHCRHRSPHPHYRATRDAPFLPSPARARGCRAHGARAEIPGTQNMSVNHTISVSVIIATHNRAARLRETLEALLEQKTPDSLGWEVVVVDNGSTDDTLEVFRTMAMRAPGRLRYVSEPRLGKSRALNAGLKAARGAVVALTDDDVSPADDWVAASATVLDKRDAHGAGGRILPRWEAEPPKWLRGTRRLRDALGIMDFDGFAKLPIPSGGHPQVWGANMVFRRSALLALGGFDVALGPVGSRRYSEEDIDIVRRMLEAGRPVVYDPDLVVFHRIPRARLTRAYFRRVMWDKGEGHALAASDSPPSATLAGVPLWRYRHLARLFGSSLFSVISRRAGAFDGVLDCTMAAGATWGQMKRARRERQHAGGGEHPRPANAVRAR